MRTVLLFWLLAIAGLADESLPRMPSVVGLSESAARQRLREHHLPKVQVVSSPGHPVGVCFRQYPDPGAVTGVPAVIYVGAPPRRLAPPPPPPTRRALPSGPGWPFFVLGQFVLLGAFYGFYRSAQGRSKRSA